MLHPRNYRLEWVRTVTVKRCDELYNIDLHPSQSTFFPVIDSSSFHCHVMLFVSSRLDQTLLDRSDISNLPVAGYRGRYG